MMNELATSTRTRQHGRIRTRLRVAYRVGAEEHSDHAESISEGGLYVDTNEVLEVGTRLVVRIDFPDHSVSHLAEVAWAIRVPDHLRDQMVCGMGLSFIDPDPQWVEFFTRWKSGLGAVS
jgi:Tfp pilus assembly protein PilZ